MGIPKEPQGDFLVHAPLEHPYRARTEPVQEWRPEKRFFIPFLGGVKVLQDYWKRCDIAPMAGCRAGYFIRPAM